MSESESLTTLEQDMISFVAQQLTPELIADWCQRIPVGDVDAVWCLWNLIDHMAPWDPSCQSDNEACWRELYEQCSWAYED